MDLYVYVDESGTFDKKHNDVFVFGGIVFLGREARDIEIRKYRHVEDMIRKNGKYEHKELKACIVTNKEKGKIFRSLNNTIRFGVVVNQQCLLDRIFESKKDKQRYLDYAFKVGLKSCLSDLISKGAISANAIQRMYVYMDEHTTATNGRYELREGLEQEFKIGTYNLKYDRFFPPLFLSLNSVQLEYCNSSKKALIRAADIVANRVFRYTLSGKLHELEDKIHIHKLP